MYVMVMVTNHSHVQSKREPTSNPSRCQRHPPIHPILDPGYWVLDPPTLPGLRAWDLGLGTYRCDETVLQASRPSPQALGSGPTSRSLKRVRISSVGGSFTARPSAMNLVFQNTRFFRNDSLAGPEGPVYIQTGRTSAVGGRCYISVVSVSTSPGGASIQNQPRRSPSTNPTA